MKAKKVAPKKSDGNFLGRPDGTFRDGGLFWCDHAAFCFFFDGFFKKTTTGG